MSAQHSAEEWQLGDLIKPGEAGNIVILGFPSDEGLKCNGGCAGVQGAHQMLL